MKIQKAKIKDLKVNTSNPRYIKDHKFKQLVKSIKELPQMLDIRPIVVNEDMVVLGGNMRLKACEKAGLKEVPIIKASELTPQQQQEFIIKDNVGFGSWDWDILANQWDNVQLGEWGLDVWQPEEEIDYTILDDFDLGDTLNDLQNGVKKAIQIEFEATDYETAQKLIKQHREKGNYIGGLIIEKLKTT